MQRKTYCSSFSESLQMFFADKLISAQPLLFIFTFSGKTCIIAVGK